MNPLIHSLGHVAITAITAYIWYRVGKKAGGTETQVKLGRKIERAIEKVCRTRQLTGQGNLTITHTETSSDEGGHQWEIIVKQHPAQEHLKP